MSVYEMQKGKQTKLLLKEYLDVTETIIETYYYFLFEVDKTATIFLTILINIPLAN